MPRLGPSPYPDLQSLLPGFIWIAAAAALVFLVARALAQAATLRLSGSSETALRSTWTPDNGAAGFRQILISILGHIDLWLSTPRGRQSSSGRDETLQAEGQAAFTPYTFVLKACLFYPLLLSLLSVTILRPHQYSWARSTSPSVEAGILLLCILSVFFARWAIAERSPRRMVGMAMTPALAILMAGLVSIAGEKLAAQAGLPTPGLAGVEALRTTAASLTVLGATTAAIVVATCAGWLGAIMVLALAALSPFATTPLICAGGFIAFIARLWRRMDSTDTPMTGPLTLGLGYSLAMVAGLGLITVITANDVKGNLQMVLGFGPMALMVVAGLIHIGVVLPAACTYRNWFAGLAPRLQTAFRQMEWLLMIGCVPAVASMRVPLSRNDSLMSATVFMCLIPALLAPFVWLSLIAARDQLLRGCRPDGRFLLARLAAIIPLTTGTLTVLLVSAAALAGALYDLLPRKPSFVPFHTVEEHIKLIEKFPETPDYQVLYALMLSPFLPVALYVLAIIVALSVRVLRPARSGFGSEFLSHNAAALATVCFSLLLVALWYVLVDATDGFVTMIRIGLAIAHIVRGLLPI
ncbi:hypothetical protein [Stappia sp. WLB 29]|uniref:hypothetical protein n=1 Tax=Stappia sp. WLB 29 TaxID=2925220 RepID=UPI0020BF3C67|nr:hypothetical protein [Stappia sp. WLB 29]